MFISIVVIVSFESDGVLLYLPQGEITKEAITIRMVTKPFIINVMDLVFRDTIRGGNYLA